MVRAKEREMSGRSSWARGPTSVFLWLSVPIVVLAMAASAAGVVGGYDGTTFGPTDDVRRSQMATMIARAYGLTPEPAPRKEG
jgi:hypothetical protein